MEKAFFASRYDRGEADYINCPMDKDEYERFYNELVNAETPTPIVVVTFLAVLELYKRAMVDLEQDEQFGDISIKYIEGSGDLVFDDSELAEE